jgi:hypothetical protein
MVISCELHYMSSATAIDNMVASVLAKLSNNLEPAALLLALNSNKGNLDNDTLCHAYYTVYYGREKPKSSVLPSTSSLMGLYGRSDTPSLPPPVVVQTDPAVYASDVCDVVLQYNDVVPQHVFRHAIRNVHPHELKNDYYHRDEICGFPFDAYLGMVNARLHAYFSSNRNLDDVLSGIKKCLCLRMLSNNMYHYRDHPAGLVLDPAIVKLMQFYTLTGFLHPSSEEAFGKHAHMIRKYKQLQKIIEELTSPNSKKHAKARPIDSISIVTVEPAHFEIEIGGHKYRLTQVQDLQAFIQPPRSRFIPVVAPRMSGKEMIHKMDEYMHPSAARLAFDEGIRFMTVLMTRLDTEKNKLHPRELYELIRELGKLYEITLEQFIELMKTRANTLADDETIFRMMEKMDEYDAQYRPTKTNPTKRYLKKLSKLHFPSSPRSPRSPPRSSRKRKREEGGGARSKTNKSKTRRSKTNKSKTRRSKS